MPRISKAAQRERQVLNLRRQGLSFDDIAARVGYANKASAHKAYKRAMERTGAEDLSDHDRRLLELDRLEALHAAAWPAAQRGDLTAIRECARLVDKRVALMGLNVAVGRPVGAPAGDPEDGDPSGIVVQRSVLEELRRERTLGSA